MTSPAHAAEVLPAARQVDSCMPVLASSKAAGAALYRPFAAAAAVQQLLQDGPSSQLHICLELFPQLSGQLQIPCVMQEQAQDGGIAESCCCLSPKLDS